MIVALTSRRYEQCLQHGQGLERWLADEAAHVTSHGWDVLMPAIGWEILRRRLFDVCFTPGGRRRDLPRSAFGAVKIVTAAIAKREAHPALVGIGIPGQHEESLPVWEGKDGDWSPYPTLNQYNVLVPEHEQIEIGWITRWRPAPSRNHPSLRHPIFDPKEHYRLVDMAMVKDSPSETTLS